MSFAIPAPAVQRALLGVAPLLAKPPQREIIHTVNRLLLLCPREKWETIPPRTPDGLLQVVAADMNVEVQAIPVDASDDQEAMRVGLAALRIGVGETAQVQPLLAIDEPYWKQLAFAFRADSHVFFLAYDPQRGAGLAGLAQPTRIAPPGWPQSALRVWGYLYRE
jgi:hypothetical protein